MNDKTIRILQCVNIMDRAGLETFLMNYYRNIDRSKIQFDFLTHRKNKGQYDDEIVKMGGRIYHAPRLMPWNYYKYKKFMKKFFLEHREYKIIHSNIDAMSYFPLKEAYHNGIPCRISHSHSTKIDKNYKYLIKIYGKAKLHKFANYFFACGKDAGSFLFNNNNFTIINNAIDTSKFKFDSKKRITLRKQMEIDDKTIVIGHVGRFIYIKNQLFLLSVLKKILETNKNYKLLLIGDGKDYSKIIDFINSNDLVDNVIVLKNRNDVNDLYNVMDIFVMPSLFEGIPLVGIEAQTNGLTCLFSSNISNEILISKKSNMINLNEGIEKWSDYIIHADYSRYNNSINEVIKKGYDIKREAERLSNIYINMYNKTKGE